MLKARAQLSAKIRKFFAARDVLEVETPLLAHSTGSDIHIQSFSVHGQGSESSGPLYLQTSPEFAMKRLLCAGSGSIFQLCKAFRVEENSKRHNPEFTMLEWYRLGFSLNELMTEVEQLVCLVTGESKIPRFTYRQVFQNHLSIDPHSVSVAELQQLTNKHIDLVANNLQRTDYLQLLLAEIIEPAMPGSWFIYDYPKEQSALAQLGLDEERVTVAKRFELFCGGMEIANGYEELTNPVEQRNRFEKDSAFRRTHGLPEYPMDERLLAALEQGLPACAGVALGFDRLLMLETGANKIDEVMSFTTKNA